MRKVVRSAVAALAIGGAGAFSGALVSFIKPQEGLRTVAYRDQGGKPTICYGHTEGVSMGDERTPEECEQMLAHELPAYVNYVDAQTHRYLPDEMRVAFADFTFNAGMKSFSQSTLLKYIRLGYYTEACNELPKWVYVHQGKTVVKSKGLIERRAAEQELCLIGAKKTLGATK